MNDDDLNEYYCFDCDDIVSEHDTLCPKCGATLDWSDIERKVRREGGLPPSIEARQSIESPQSFDPELRLFTHRAIGVATGLGGPLAGAYLLSKNFRSLGKDAGARLSLNIGIVITLLLGILAVSLSEEAAASIPNKLLPIFFGLIGYLVVRQFQQKEISAHLAAGGKKGSLGIVLGTSLISAALLVGFVIGMMYILPTHDEGVEQPFTGLAMNFEESGSTLYYDPIIATTEAKNVGTLLHQIDYFNKEYKLPAGFHKQKEVYVIELFVDKENWSRPEIISPLHWLLKTLKQNVPDRTFRLKMVAVTLDGTRDSSEVLLKD